MKILPLIYVAAVLISSSFSAYAATGADLLFKGKIASLSTTEKEEIYKIIDVKVSLDGTKLIDRTCENEVDFDIQVKDLNNDKIPEVVVIGGNTCSSGATGSSIWLFIKNKGGYQTNLGFPAAGYEVMKQSTKGYPNLLISGSGFCSAIWQWNGTKYQYLKNVPTSKGGCDGH
jgi:hypothetical protein